VHVVLFYPVCVTGGYLMSYWNRPFFPEWCSDSTLDDISTYDTMVRIAGSWDGNARAFKAVADLYGWTHIVVILCWTHIVCGHRLDTHRGRDRRRGVDVLVRGATFLHAAGR